MDEEGRPIVGYDEDGNPIYGYDANGNPIYGYDENGRPIIGYDENGNPIYGDAPLGYDEDGNPIYGYDENGNPILGYDEDGRPIIGYDEDGNPIYGDAPVAFDEDGNPIYGYDEDGNPILGYDEDGRPIIGYDEDGNPIYGDAPIAYDKDGNPIYGFDEDGNPIYGYDENGRPIIGYDEDGNPIYGDKPGFDENGKPLPGFGPDGKPLPGYGPDGKLLPGYDKNGKLIAAAPEEDLAQAEPKGDMGEGESQGMTPTGQPVASTAAGLTAEQAEQRANAVAALSGSISEQMGAILENKSNSSVQSIVLTDPSFLEDLNEEKEEEAAEEGEETLVQEIIVPAGDIVYAQMVLEANSDIDGPVLAEIVVGPLKGARLIGSFTMVEDRYLTLTFDSIVIDGIAQPTNAIAVDPDTSLTGMATEIDNHTLQRVVIPLAASFLEGAAQAIADSGLTTVTIEGDTVATEESETSEEHEIAAGVAEAGSELRTILEDMIPDEPTVIIAAGTPVGIMFTQPVVEDAQ